ncbi:MAG TPA: mannose-6-phosphate isomerase, class I [Spirochaetia bacterium]|nr:mannose-6-phosphate isomerase, class I [Spirochaetaceae bacterium]HPE88582.1 mannose-6-phosphate isomerase, class I [Spirochaetales bacterium]HRW25119.1 mannose-6-phosphate isomerase, class I [Spirochaetia bacterium]
MAIYSLDNTVQHYAWGSTDALPAMLGKENPSGEPWAELWMGAHPRAPSLAVDPVGGERKPLDALIADDPDATIGPDAARRFGGKLPFLFKLLSAAKPLSIQAHPSKRKAEHGFALEESKGIPIDAAERNYKDPNHKPETVVAQTAFEGLCGFRPIVDIIDNARLIAPDDWERLIGRLAYDPCKLELSSFFYLFVSIGGDHKAKRLRYAKARSERIVADEPKSSERSRLFSWILRLMDEYPGDIGALAPLALNLFELRPGEAINLPPGEPHAYLRGTAAEIMANSDNVLRGGLTSKHVDIPEFISTLGFDSAVVEPLEPILGDDGFYAYPCGVPDYSLSRAEVDGALPVGARAASPEILLCVDGTVSLEAASGAAIELPRGASAFVCADERAYVLRGSGAVYRAGVPA